MSHNEEIFEGLIIAGAPSEISKAISKIIAAGFTFEPYYDPQYLGDAVIVLALGRTESDLLEAPGLVDAPPVEEVVEPTIEEKLQVVTETAKEINEEVEEPAPGVPAVEVIVAPELEEIVAPPVPVKRTRKPKVVVEAPEGDAPETVEE